MRPIPLLAVPKGELPIVLQQCRDYSAIRLFCERAAAVRPDFDLSSQNVPDVVSICRSLDGLPLAIELAAALVEALSIRDIVGHLDDRFDLLQTGDRTASRRHQALKATLDWSYNHMTMEEQTLLCRLCVFSGGWTLSAAEALFPASTMCDERMQRPGHVSSSSWREIMFRCLRGIDVNNQVSVDGALM